MLLDRRAAKAIQDRSDLLACAETLAVLAHRVSQAAGVFLEMLDSEDSEVGSSTWNQLSEFLSRVSMQCMQSAILCYQFCSVLLLMKNSVIYLTVFTAQQRVIDVSSVSYVAFSFFFFLYFCNLTFIVYCCFSANKRRVDAGYICSQEKIITTTTMIMITVAESQILPRQD